MTVALRMAVGVRVGEGWCVGVALTVGDAGTGAADVRVAEGEIFVVCDNAVVVFDGAVIEGVLVLRAAPLVAARGEGEGAEKAQPPRITARKNNNNVLSVVMQRWQAEQLAYIFG